MKFEVLIKRVRLSPHPKADRLEIARVDDYQCVVAKDTYREGDLVIYIPIGAKVPTQLLRYLGLEGMLGGTEKNRVCPVTLRGVISMGLVAPIEVLRAEVPLLVPKEGMDVADLLGITKYVYPLPKELDGLAVPCAHGVSFDVEDILKFPGVLLEGEAVVVTEKLHGQFIQVGLNPSGDYYIASKELAHHQQSFILSNTGNAFVGTAMKYMGVLTELAHAISPTSVVFFLGELYGSGVMKLRYDALDHKAIRLFDCYIGDYPYGSYMSRPKLYELCKGVGVPTVPIIYQGPYDPNQAYYRPESTLSTHLMEGVVINPVEERWDPAIGRVMLKQVSPAYLGSPDWV